MHGENLKLVDI